MEKETPNYVFDGFCHRPYNERIDGWRMEMMGPEDMPAVSMARDIIAMYDEINALRKENWYLRQRLSHYEPEPPKC